MATTAGSSARFRQRKISVKQNLQIFQQSDIPDLEDEQQREFQQVETGVEKGEEDEHHLKQAINASYAATTGQKVEQVYIPTPDASKRWNEYEKYYQPVFREPHSYIRMSATVEDVSGCPYCMDEEDEEFLQKFNADRSPQNKCTEDEFEMICHRFEQMLAIKQPFIAVDPTQILSFEELAPSIIESIQEEENDPVPSPEYLLATTTSSLYLSTLKKNHTKRKSPLVSFKQFGQGIYPHWRARKIARHGKPIFPVLKFEESAEKDDNDPYVCFRRREVRQVRKTRRADQQSSERLRRLQAEMEQAKKLMEMVAQREQMRKEQLQLEWDIFERRCSVKDLKRSLGIKGEDEDLVAHKKKKEEKKPVPVAANAAGGAVATEKANGAAAGASAAATSSSSTSNSSSSALPIHSLPANMRLPASKIPETEMAILEHVLNGKENAIRSAVKNKLKARAQADKDWVNYTDNPFVPYCDYFDPDQDHRNNMSLVDPKYASYSSIAAPYPPSSDVELKLPLALSLGSSYASRVEQSPLVLRTSIDSDGDVKVEDKLTDLDLSHMSSTYTVPRRSAVSLRRRRGRGGRMLIDRRGLIRRPTGGAEFGTVNLDKEVKDQDGDVTMGEEQSSVSDDYWSQWRRDLVDDRFKYDLDVVDKMEYTSCDPSRLNGISDETQAIRFGSMLLSKAYDSYREAYQLRQQQLVQLQQKMMQQQLARANGAAAVKKAAAPPVQGQAVNGRMIAAKGNGMVQGDGPNGHGPTAAVNGGTNSASSGPNTPNSIPARPATVNGTDAAQIKAMNIVRPNSGPPQGSSVNTSMNSPMDAAGNMQNNNTMKVGMSPRMSSTPGPHHSTPPTKVEG